MSDLKKDQIGQWLKKLEQESWQLELLVSAFTIFLLIQATSAFDNFYDDLPFQYNLNDGILSFIYLFFGLMGTSLQALSLFLIIHLMLRGFWIGTIGLRSVQSKIDFSKLQYSDFFNKKLKKRIVSLDEMVIMLDEMCSVIFSLSFLVISVLLALGMYLLFLGLITLVLNSLAGVLDGWMLNAIVIASFVIIISILVSGIIYMVDYFSMGFFKKYKWLSRVYYPIYKFYGVITISVISRSIYYYLISKFSKKRIRIIYLVFGLTFLVSIITEYDQHQYFSEVEDEITLGVNYYDNLRSDEAHISKLSIPSNVIEGAFLQLFLRYNPGDNELIKKQCPEYEPIKNDGLNLTIGLKLLDQGISIEGQKHEGEDFAKLLECQSLLYKVFINDSLYTQNNYYFFTHGKNQQKGLLTMLSTEAFVKGENILRVKKSVLDDEGKETLEDYAYVPFWFN